MVYTVIDCRVGLIVQVSTSVLPPAICDLDQGLSARFGGAPLANQGLELLKGGLGWRLGRLAQRRDREKQADGQSCIASHRGFQKASTRGRRIFKRGRARHPDHGRRRAAPQRGFRRQSPSRHQSAPTGVAFLIQAGDARNSKAAITRDPS